MLLIISYRYWDLIQTVALLTFEITVLSAKLLEIAIAISIGLVSQLLPSLTVPSGKLILIDSRGAAIESVNMITVG